MKAVLEFLKILADETRLQILILLSRRDMCVCEIMDELGMSQPAVSHHLRMLKKSGLVRDDKDGRWVFYSLQQKAFARGVAGLHNDIFDQISTNLENRQSNRDYSACLCMEERKRILKQTTKNINTAGQVMRAGGRRNDSMRIAVFSDIHSNKHALDAVLADIHGREPDLVACLGDLVGYGAYPNAVVQAIRESGIPTVMGNYDDAIANRRLVCGCDYQDEKAIEAGVKSISWTMENANESSKEFLLSLPDRMVMEIGERRVLFVHGSPRKLNEYLYEDLPASDILTMLQEASADVLVCGHTHIPYHRIVEGRHIINAGSAGKPKHGDPRAVYALIEMNGEIRVSFIKVPYDFEAAARAVERAGLPAEFASILRTGIG